MSPIDTKNYYVVDRFVFFRRSIIVVWMIAVFFLLDGEHNNANQYVDNELRIIVMCNEWMEYSEHIEVTRGSNSDATEWFLILTLPRVSHVELYEWILVWQNWNGSEKSLYCTWWLRAAACECNDRNYLRAQTKMMSYISWLHAFAKCYHKISFLALLHTAIYSIIRTSP